MRWYIDDTELDLTGGRGSSKVSIGREASFEVPNLGAGNYRIPWLGKRVELRRVRVGNSSETAAGTMIFGALACFWQARKRPESMGALDVAPEFSVDEDYGPRVVGARCGHCDEKIKLARSASYCEECRSVLHDDCVDDHACEAPTTGPDWAAITNA